MESFKGKVAIVTGAASGIGFALCERLLEHGAVVVAVDLNNQGLTKLQNNNPNRSLEIHNVDITNNEDVEKVIDSAVERHGHLDFMFNNAGIVVGGKFASTGIDSWNKIIDINLYGVIYGCLYAYQKMMKQGFGHIVNTSSTAGITPVSNSVAYSTTKHAVVGLSTSLRQEAKQFNIRVSVVIPGIVDTNIFSSADNLGNHNYQKEIDKVPLKKISPSQAANEILNGVMKNKEFIIFPFYNKCIVILYRLFPGLISKLVNKQIET
jgi:short-subunit dehydrogenase